MLIPCLVFQNVLILEFLFSLVVIFVKLVNCILGLKWSILDQYFTLFYHSDIIIISKSGAKRNHADIAVFNKFASTFRIFICVGHKLLSEIKFLLLSASECLLYQVW